MISKILEIYARSGISLKDLGLQEAALPLSEAIQSLNYFSELQWVLLGGDIYQYKDTCKLEPTYENWFYSGDNVQESINTTYDFLESLKSRECFVVFVFLTKKP